MQKPNAARPPAQEDNPFLPSISRINPDKAKGELRLDPAPCWNRTGDAIVVPGIAPDGTRQMFIVTLNEP